ncbi:MAG: halocyanin domain-containing protein [Halalkalicoccus sp.]
MSEDRDRDLSRRLFMRESVIGGTATAGALAASGSAVAQEEEEEEAEGEEGEEDTEGEEEENGEGEEGDGGGGDEEPDWSSFVEDAPNFDSTDDQRGEEEVTVDVGGGDDGLTFEPAAIWVDPGTTVIWEWTGEGGAHNVNGVEGEEFQSDTTDEAGFTFEHTFEEEGINEYECSPHTAQNMHGGVAVGEDIETREVQDAAGGDDGATGVELPDTARAVGVALTVAFGSTLGLAYVFMKYGGDYEGDRIE